MKISTLVTIIAISALLAPVSAIADEQWKIDAVKYYEEEAGIPGLMVRRTTVQFKNGKHYAIPLYRAKPITVLNGADGFFFLLAEGADCTNCDENIGLRFYELGNPELKHGEKRHSYPGRLFNLMDPTVLLEESRTFYGRCLNDASDSVLWFIKYLGEDSQWHSVGGVVNVSKEGDNLKKLTPEETSLKSVLEAVKRGSCLELPGIDRTTEP